MLLLHRLSSQYDPIILKTKRIRDGNAKLSHIRVRDGLLTRAEPIGMLLTHIRCNIEARYNEELLAIACIREERQSNRINSRRSSARASHSLAKSNTGRWQKAIRSVDHGSSS